MPSVPEVAASGCTVRLFTMNGKRVGLQEERNVKYSAGVDCKFIYWAHPQYNPEYDTLVKSIGKVSLHRKLRCGEARREMR